MCMCVHSNLPPHTLESKERYQQIHCNRGSILKREFFVNVIHTFNLCKVQSCGEWVECMGVASGCGEQEVGVASGSGWNLWVWLLGVVVRIVVYKRTKK